MPTSITINWHEAQSTESIVEYGTTAALGQTTTGDTHTFNASTLWHRVKLTGLQPDTEYFYQCKTGTAASDILKFRTFPANTVSQGHFRIGIYGDTRSDAAEHTQVVNAMKDTVESLYGTNIQNQLNLVFNVGDIVGSGGSLSAYSSQYFNPIKNLSGNVPFMVSIGNHEQENANYYNYMNYEDLGGPQGGKYYSFRAGPILILALNSNGSMRNQTQLDWIESKLIAAQADTTIDWVQVFCHHPGHSELWPAGNTRWVNDSVIPLLANYDKVCGLCYGHSHDFEMGAHPDAPFRLMLNGGGGSVLDNWGDYSNQTDYPEIYKSWDHFGYTIIDFDLANRSYTAKTYSLGHQHKSLDNVLIDEFYQKREGTSAPQTPQALTPAGNVGLSFVLTASAYTGVEEIMSSHFQVTSTSGDYSSPIVDSRRDWVNIYWDTGAPDYNMVDKNAGIDLERLSVNSGTSYGQTLFWRVRYRDQNLAWSEWSPEQTFTISAEPADTDGDEMPDEWETSHGLDPLIDDASAHSDSDSYNNWFEYVTDTNPQDGNSWQTFSLDIPPATGEPTLRFSTSGDRLYTVLYRTNLTNGVWENLGTTFSGTGSETNLSDSSGESPRFYRLQIELP